MSQTARSIPLPSAMSLADRRVAVTGAASGIGLATAKAVAQLGANVAGRFGSYDASARATPRRRFPGTSAVRRRGRWESPCSCV